ncbi:hypothetical protein PNE73_21755, partial [Escherichia coli]|nr:hypothetical protein [Escherichia coli]
DRNRSHWSTSKTPSYTKSVSWQHHLSFIQRCIDRGDDIRDYSIYFDNKPGHVDRYDTMYRKVKYILGI